MLDKFEKGKKYVFKKELLLGDIKNSFDDELIKIMLGGWADDIDGKVVDVIDSMGGHANFYSVMPEWCEEIVTEPLKIRDDIKGMYEQILHLEELEELLDAIDEYMPSGRLKSNFLKCTNSEIERIIDELELEE